MAAEVGQRVLSLHLLEPLNRVLEHGQADGCDEVKLEGM